MALSTQDVCACATTRARRLTRARDRVGQRRRRDRERSLATPHKDRRQRSESKFYSRGASALRPMSTGATPSAGRSASAKPRRQSRWPTPSSRPSWCGCYSRSRN